MLRVAINGFGRIGRMVLRAIYENQYKGLKVVAINNRAKPETSAFLLERDTIHGKFNFNIKYTKDEIIVGKDKIQCYHESDPINCPWDEEKIDIVFECTGKFNSKEDSYKHIEAGAKKVIVSAPCKEADQTVVYGVNEKNISKKDEVISVASCTTNCLAPLAHVIHKNFKIEKGYMTTIHSYTTDQRLLDNSHKDLRRARSAPNAMVPTSTGAAKSLKLIIPELAGKIDGLSVRVPTPNVSLVQLSFNSKKKMNEKLINDALTKASKTYLKNVLGVETMPLVSSDFNHDSRSSIVDAGLTKVISDNFATVFSWYDNEWGFSNRMIDVALTLKNKL
ncbi:type I glyceraldehyde-3-phosphate dehydrogenase [Pelagibacteraceae bacterium]|nr:type I glyceraldehyde-3-phosphate dehydrogenase [Pelagibacteraceae bacterium]